jgi:hypothetical protein
MALTMLAHLRSLPILRSVARRIPAHWQRRVKNWLQVFYGRFSDTPRPTLLS